MRRFLIPVALIATSVTAFAGEANAALLVEQWNNNRWFSGLEGADAIINSREADYASTWEVIDFTDDPLGFAGLLPGSNRWLAAEANDISGTNEVLNNFFVARISGEINVNQADTYSFRTFADDGLRLRVDGQDVIFDNTYHPERQHVGSIFLNPGTYDLDLVFFEGWGEASLEFTAKSSTGEYDHIGNTFVTANEADVSVPEPASNLGLFAIGAIAAGGTLKQKVLA